MLAVFVYGVFIKMMWGVLYGFECQYLVIASYLFSFKSDFRCHIFWIPLHKFNQWKSTKSRRAEKMETEDKDCWDRETER